jgi:hypothetical protein
MRVASLVAVLLAALVAASGATTSQFVVAEKDPAVGGKPTYDGRDIGDNMATPFDIPSLPFMGTGSTCPYLNDYDEACPYPESVAPDVVYAYLATADVVVNVSLCESSYDTKLYIYENVEGDLVCCNDDAGCGPNGYASYMENIFLYAGNTYFFIIDGYNEDCGEYVLQIDPVSPCALTAPPGAIIEGEPACGPGYVDNYNGGCNSDPPVFQPIMPSTETITIFGTSGTFDGLSRDTDWYQIYMSASNTVTFSVRAEFPVLIFFLDANLPLGCDDPGLVISSATGSACDLVSLTETIGPGLYWLWVGPSVFSCQPCGLEYIVEIDGYVGPSPVEDASWATIKALYR